MKRKTFLLLLSTMIILVGTLVVLKGQFVSSVFACWCKCQPNCNTAGHPPPPFTTCCFAYSSKCSGCYWNEACCGCNGCPDCEDTVDSCGGEKYKCTSPNACTKTSSGEYDSESDCLDGPGQCGDCVACKCWAGGSIAGESSSPPSSYASSQEGEVLGESQCQICQNFSSVSETEPREDVAEHQESFDQVLEKAKLFWAVITDFIKGFIN